ncbi:MAG: DUF448 domain-containing protein [Parvularculaceae bacterium]
MPKNPRTCIATGAELGERTPALRFVCGPDGALVADLAGKLPGRGAWVVAQRSAIEKALSKGLFARAFKEQTRLASDQSPEQLINWISAELSKRALASLGLARRAGQLVVGFDKVHAGVKKGELGTYIHAMDGALDGVGKITALAAALNEAAEAGEQLQNGGPIRIVSRFDNDALTEATGLPNAVHLGLPRAAQKSFHREVSRLSGLQE